MCVEILKVPTAKFGCLQLRADESAKTDEEERTRCSSMPHKQAVDRGELVTCFPVSLSLCLIKLRGKKGQSEGKKTQPDAFHAII